MLANRPFTDWKHIIGGNTKAPKVKDSFFINIAGREYEIPFDVWYITQVLNIYAIGFCLWGRW
jgi:hypothetical protein